MGNGGKGGKKLSPEGERGLEREKCMSHAGDGAQIRDLPCARRESVAPHHGVCFDK